MSTPSETTPPQKFYATRSLVILVALAGIAFSLFGLFHTSISLYAVKFTNQAPHFHQHEFPHFYPVLYGMSFITLSLDALLLFASLQLLSFRMGWSLLLTLLMVFEVIYFKSVLAAWLHPTFGKSIMAATPFANGALAPFYATKFPYWAPLIAIWGWFRLPAPPPDPKPRRRVLIAFASLLTILCGIPLVGMVLFRRDLTIEYHKARMRWAFDSRLVNPNRDPSGQSFYQIDQTQLAIYERHRDHLIDLGVVREFNYTCRHLFYGTPEGRHFQRLRPMAPWSIDGSSPHKTDKTPIHWTFWCFAEEEPRLKQSFQEHDIPDYREKFMKELPPEPNK